MNYLQLCQATRERVGIHGSGPSTVVSPTDVEADIVASVYDAWIDIQNFREDWDWMRATETFLTVAGTTNYSTTTIGGPGHRIDRFLPDTLWINDGTNWYKPTWMANEDNFEFLFKNDTEQAQPSHWTRIRSDNSITMNPPDAAYSCQIDYRKTPQELSGNTDTPEMPAQWHLLIVYSAVQKLSASIGSQSTGVEYAQRYAEMLGQLTRRHLPKKSVKTRSIA